MTHVTATARPTMLPDLESLALLVDVADVGSIGGAARAYGLSQPSASVRLEHLEQRLGQQLLVRSTSGSTLTTAGELVVGWAAPILAAAEELSRGVQALQRESTAELTVAASLTIAEYLMPDWLVRLHAENPDVAVRLQVANSTDVIAAVRAGDVPLGFVEGPSVPRDLAAKTVAMDRLVVVAAPEHPWARRRDPLGMTEFRATPLLLREPESGTRQALERAVGGAEHLAEPALQLSTTTAIRNAAAAGTAPAVLSELTVASDIAAGRLVEIPVAGLGVTRRLRAIRRRGVAPSAAANALLRLVAR